MIAKVIYYTLWVILVVAFIAMPFVVSSAAHEILWETGDEVTLQLIGGWSAFIILPLCVGIFVANKYR